MISRDAADAELDAAVNEFLPDFTPPTLNRRTRRIVARLSRRAAGRKARGPRWLGVRASTEHSPGHIRVDARQHTERRVAFAWYTWLRGATVYVELLGNQTLVLSNVRPDPFIVQRGPTQHQRVLWTGYLRDSAVPGVPIGMLTKGRQAGAA